MGPICRAAGVALVCALAAPSTALANPRSVELRRQGFVHAYNLDYGEAMSSFQQAIAADPQDPGAYRAVAALAWLELIYRRGSITVDGYLGGTNQPNLKLGPPPADLVTLFQTNVQEAIRLAEAQVERRPSDPGAIYSLGAAVGQLAVYVATVDGRIFGGFKAARRAFDAHERVMELDASRRDAALIPGTYRYVVASLGTFTRWMAYLAGFGGGRERAIQLLESCAAYPSDVQPEAKLTLVLIYSRERRFDQAMRLLDAMRGQYPRNRLLWLESGATTFRAGHPAEALALVDTGMAMFQNDPRPKAFGEAALWHYKRGAVLVALGQRERAGQDLRAALELEAHDWIRGRAQVELGKLADLAGSRAAAKAAYARGAELCRRDSDPLGVADAERLLRQGYTGTNGTPSRQY
ncbi:MAG: hypothetical protein NTY02_00420 [Acidobacteria bacterium]|nr:hypothetical protein [Acidobacteriota bacterium]